MIRLAKKIDELLPQTQCKKCGFKDCLTYANTIAKQDTDYNRCIPGGDTITSQIAKLLGIDPKSTTKEFTKDNQAMIATIDESNCIGCTLCIQKCPVSAIIGTTKHLHSVIEKWCTGCELCITACPMDCIRLMPLESGLRINDPKKFTQVSRDRYYRLQKIKNKNFDNKNISGTFFKENLNTPNHRDLLDQKNSQVDKNHSSKRVKKFAILAQAIARANHLRNIAHPSEQIKKENT